jgi:hypothetical protein
MRMRDRIDRSRWMEIPEAIIPVLTGVDDPDALLAESWELSDRFLESDLWREVESMDLHYEVPFLLGVDTGGTRRIVRGRIDLLAVGDDAARVIDFKTDKQLDPTHYEGQMAVYRAAAADLFDRRATTTLYALRTGGAVRVDAEIDAVVAEILASPAAASHLGWDYSSATALM